MARVVGEANPVPFSERTFLTQKDLANHTGIGISCIRKKIMDRLLPVQIGMQNRG